MCGVKPDWVVRALSDSLRSTKPVRRGVPWASLSPTPPCWLIATHLHKPAATQRVSDCGCHRWGGNLTAHASGEAGGRCAVCGAYGACPSFIPNKLPVRVPTEVFPRHRCHSNRTYRCQGSETHLGFIVDCVTVCAEQGGKREPSCKMF